MIHNGLIRARVEQEHGRLAVYLPIEQDHSVDAVERHGIGSALLPMSRRAEQKRENESQEYPQPQEDEHVRISGESFPAIRAANDAGRGLRSRRREYGLKSPSVCITSEA